MLRPVAVAVALPLSVLPGACSAQSLEVEVARPAEAAAETAACHRGAAECWPLPHRSDQAEVTRGSRQ